MKMHTTILFVAAAVGLAGLGAVSSPDESSSTLTKHETLHKGHHPYGLANKGGGQLEVTLVSNVATPIPSGRKFVLTATVATTAAMDDLRYEWILPEGVTAATGANLSGTLGDLAEGGTVDTTIQLQTANDNNALVHLHVYRLIGGEPTGQMTQFNTRDQSKIASEMNAKVEALGMGKGGRGPASTHTHKRIYQ